MNIDKTIRYYIIINDEKINKNFFKVKNNNEINEKTKKNEKCEQKKNIKLLK